jgi:hypothetical protein
MITKVDKQHFGSGESSINTDDPIQAMRGVSGPSGPPLASLPLAGLLELPDWSQGEMRLGAPETSRRAFLRLFELDRCLFAGAINFKREVANCTSPPSSGRGSAGGSLAPRKRTRSKVKSKEHPCTCGPAQSHQLNETTGCGYGQLDFAM